MIHREVDLPLRAVRDLAANEVDEIRIGDPDTHERVTTYLRQADPDLVERIRLHVEEDPLFDRFGVEKEARRALRSRVRLESGGYIVVSPTEALVAVDVNTGRYIGEGSLETTALQTNLEAAHEVARQIRLRDLSGIIVVDFIDMMETDHRTRVLEVLAEELAKDRTKSQISGMSEFGLVEVTRKRSRIDLLRQMTRLCPCCQGIGRVKDATAATMELRRELLRRCSEIAGRPVRVRAHPQVVAALNETQKTLLEELEQKLNTTIEVEEGRDLPFGGYEILAD